jgi:hypothetical protein
MELEADKSRSAKLSYTVLGFLGSGDIIYTYTSSISTSSSYFEPSCRCK